MGLNNEKKLVISNGTWEMAKENKWLNKKVVCIIALVIISLSLWFLWPSSEKIDADFVVYIEGNGSPITFKIEPEYIKVAKDQEIQLEVIGYFVSNSMIPGRKPYIIEPQDVVVVELPDKKLYRMSDRVVWHTNAD
ncbi:MAG: hypothetical protein Q8Q23_02615, partial [bacterium]|nr:hypothetical protein [bacterium]